MHRGGGSSRQQQQAAAGCHGSGARGRWPPHRGIRGRPNRCSDQWGPVGELAHQDALCHRRSWVGDKRQLALSVPEQEPTGRRAPAAAGGKRVRPPSARSWRGGLGQLDFRGCAATAERRRQRTCWVGGTAAGSSACQRIRPPFVNNWMSCGARLMRHAADFRPYQTPTATPTTTPTQDSKLDSDSGLDQTLRTLMARLGVRPADRPDRQDAGPRCRAAAAAFCPGRPRSALDSLSERASSPPGTWPSNEMSEPAA